MTRKKNMSIREFAKDRGFQIVGKLTYRGVLGGSKWYTDEAGNDYYKNSKGCICIADIYGTVY